MSSEKSFAASDADEVEASVRRVRRDAPCIVPVKDVRHAYPTPGHTLLSRHLPQLVGCVVTHLLYVSKQRRTSPDHNHAPSRRRPIPCRPHCAPRPAARKPPCPSGGDLARDFINPTNENTITKEDFPLDDGNILREDSGDSSRTSQVMRRPMSASATERRSAYGGAIGAADGIASRLALGASFCGNLRRHATEAKWTKFSMTQRGTIGASV